MTTVIPVSDTGPTKGAIIDMAFEDCRLSGFDFDRTPEENLMALRRLNTMMAEWPWSNVGYAYPTFGEGSADELSDVPSDAVHGVSQMLAMRLMSAFGKSIPESFRITSAQSIAYVRGQYSSVPKIGFAPGTLRGQGARRDHSFIDPYFPVTE